MKKNFIVHTAVTEDVTVSAELNGKKVQAKVPGLTVELVSMEDGRAHTHTFNEEVEAAQQLFVPGQELTITYARKSGADTVHPDDADPDAAQQYANPALTDAQKTKSQREDEDKSKAAFKAGTPDPITVPKAAAK